MRNLCIYCVAYIDFFCSLIIFLVFVFVFGEQLCTRPILRNCGLCSSCVCVFDSYVIWDSACGQWTYSPTVDLSSIGSCQRWDIELDCRIGALQSVCLVQLLHNVFYFPKSDSSSIRCVKCEQKWFFFFFFCFILF